MKIEDICKNTIIQAGENIKYRLEKNKNKKVKVIDNHDYTVMLMNIDILLEEIRKIDKKGKYKIDTYEKQIEIYKKRLK